MSCRDIHLLPVLRARTHVPNADTSEQVKAPRDGGVPLLTVEGSRPNPCNRCLTHACELGVFDIGGVLLRDWLRILQKILVAQSKGALRVLTFNVACSANRFFARLFRISASLGGYAPLPLVEEQGTLPHR